MKLSITIAVAGLLLTPALLNASWRYKEQTLPGYGQYDVGAGSALCYGVDYQAAGSPACVWLLHGNCSQDRNHFQRFSATGTRTWTAKANLPYSNSSEYVGWGGALAYGPDPYPIDSGRVFAFTGNNTDLFWLYSPPANQWYSRPSVPHAVGAGGALCFGGIQSLGGTLSAVFYAFVGGGYPYFYRYSYPMQGASNGTWEEGLANLSDGQDDQAVGAGGALAWVPRTDSSAVYPMGQVFALRGQGSYHLYSYNPYTDAWRVEYTFPYDILVDSGAAMAHGPEQAEPPMPPDIRFLAGGHTDAYLVWDPAGGISKLKFSQPSPCPQNAGAALCEGEGPHSCYAVFGESTRDTFAWHNGLDPREEDGEESRFSAMSEKVSVNARAGLGEHRFIVSCAPGPVCLKVVDCVGKVVAKADGQAAGGGVDLTWRHGRAGPGVYFYVLETPSGSGSGKLVVPR